MKKFLLVILPIAILSSCATQTRLYNWGHYENTSYSYLKKRTDKSTQQLIDDYKKIIANQKELRKVPPPGAYADYGYLLLQAGRSEDGKSMLLKEIEIYPESKVFLDRIIQMFSEEKKEEAKEEVKEAAPEAKKPEAKPSVKSNSSKSSNGNKKVSR